MTVLFCLCALTAVGDQGDRREGIALLDQVRLSRKEIRQYHLVVLNQVRHAKSVSSQANSETSRYTVWSDGKRQRCDFVKLESNVDPDAVGRRRVWCRNCPRDGYVSTTSVGPGYVSPLGFTKDDGGVARNDGFRIDWEQLGMIDGGIASYWQERPDVTVVAFRNHPDVVHDRVTMAGRPAHRFTAVAKDGIKLDLWVRPDVGMNPVMFEATAPAIKFVQKTVIEYTKAAGTEIWFPRSVHHIRTRDGRTVLEETLTVETSEINQPVSPEVFTMEGFGMPKGTPIEVPEIPKTENQPTWDGEQVDYNRTRGQQTAEAYDALFQSQPPVPDTPEPGRRLPYYFGAALLAVAGGTLLTLALRRRRATAG